MADANEKNVRKKKEREPIALVCFVVLLIACAGVLSAYAYDTFIADKSGTVVYGDKVVIDYTGSLYGYYDEASDSVIPVIFDTTLESVYKDGNNVLVSSFNKTSFETTTITLGAGKFLKAFENAIIGKNIGDTIKVKISAADAYPAANCNEFAENSITSFENSFVIGLDEYKTLFDKTEAPKVGTADLTDKNGLPATVLYDGSVFTVTYTPEVGHEYSLVDNKVGKVTMVPTSVTGDLIEYELKIENSKAISDSKVSDKDGCHSVQEIEMISFGLFRDTYNIVGYDSTGIIYNSASSSSDAIHNMDLFFVIKIISKG